MPTYRPDITREIDLIEEVARRVGIDSIERTVPTSPEKVGGLTQHQRDRRTIADVLVGAGYDEVFSLPLVATADVTRAGLRADGAIEVENPLRSEESILRPALLPGVLRAVSYNASHGEGSVALFESGRVFFPPAPGHKLPDERHHLAFARSHAVRRGPVEPDRPVDVYDATAVVQALVTELRLADVRLEAARVDGLHPGRAARIMVDGEPVGVVGEVAGDVIANLDLQGPVVACELDADAIFAGTRRERYAAPISRFPASTVDLAFVVADTVPAAAVEATLAAAGGELLEQVRLFDVFRSDALGAGKVSLAFALQYRALDRTLTDDEVGTLRRTAIDTVVRTHDAELRA